MYSYIIWYIIKILFINWLNYCPVSTTQLTEKCIIIYRVGIQTSNILLIQFKKWFVVTRQLNKKIWLNYYFSPPELGTSRFFNLPELCWDIQFSILWIYNMLTLHSSSKLVLKQQIKLWKCYMQIRLTWTSVFVKKDIFFFNFIL